MDSIEKGHGHAYEVARRDRSVTELLVEWGQGDQAALEDLIPRVYGELRRLARAQFRRERPGHTLQTTAVIHEVYLRLVDQKRVEWRDRAHFFGLAARLMRQILVDHARRKRVVKRGGGQVAISLDKAPFLTNGREPDLLKVDEALRSLEEEKPELARLVELRFFGGLTQPEAAEALGFRYRRSRGDGVWQKPGSTASLPRSSGRRDENRARQ